MVDSFMAAKLLQYGRRAPVLFYVARVTFSIGIVVYPGLVNVLLELLQRCCPLFLSARSNGRIYCMSPGSVFQFPSCLVDSGDMPVLVHYPFLSRLFLFAVAVRSDFFLFSICQFLGNVPAFRR